MLERRRHDRYRAGRIALGQFRLYRPGRCAGVEV